MSEDKEKKDLPPVSTEPWVPLPSHQWTEPERWAWERIRTGQPADFNERYGNELDPKNEALWTEEEKKRRGLRADFLYTVLLNHPWQLIIKNTPVIIIGAWFDGQLNMPAARVENFLGLGVCRIDHGIIFNSVFFTHGLKILSCRVGALANLGRIKTPANLSLKGSLIRSLKLIGAEIGGELNMDKVTFEKNLEMDGAFIAGGLFLKWGNFKVARLHGIQVNGQFTMKKATFDGPLIMEKINVKGSLHMRKAIFKKEVNLALANIEGHIAFEGAKFQILNLASTNVEGFADGITRNNSQGAWPDKLNLDHFTYKHIRGIPGRHDSQDLTDRPASWFVSWLAKHKPYSPQPYQQCAKVLREAGQPWKAAEVLFAGKERERKNSIWYRWLWLWFFKWSVGYGLGIRFRILPAFWALCLLVAGYFVFWHIPETSKYSGWWAWGYSLNRLLPIVNLHPGFAEIKHFGLWPGAWFVFQTLCGWVLAALIAAGLAGVGKPGGRD
ncbi:MAG: hypothetical protein AB1814_02450 [Thermodesulfobacteriota bacterium]